jgi:hypothetical protein
MAKHFELTISDDTFSFTRKTEAIAEEARFDGLIKLLWYDGQGMCLFSKRLERGHFVWPTTNTGRVSLSPAQVSMLLEGIDWRMPQSPSCEQAATAVEWVGATVSGPSLLADPPDNFYRANRDDYRTQSTDDPIPRWQPAILIVVRGAVAGTQDSRCAF